MSLLSFATSSDGSPSFAVIAAAHDRRDARGQVVISDTDLETVAAELRAGASAARKTATGAVGRDTAGRVVYRLHRPLLSVDGQGRGVGLCTEQWDVLRAAVA